MLLKSSDSHSGLADKLQAALDAKHGTTTSGSGEYAYNIPNHRVSDVFDGKVVHREHKTGKKFVSKYKQDDAGKVTLGEPAPVETAYTPLAEAATRGLAVAANQFEESAYDKAKGELTITIIKPGFNTSKSRYYPKSTLQRDFKIFEGAKMFANHQTAAEAKARPEGDVRDWVANVGAPWVESDGRIRSKAKVHDQAFKDKLAGLQEAGLLHEMGISIRAAGLQQEAMVEGHKTMFVESFILSKSVDFVTYPGAGGHVNMMESDNDTDIDTMSFTMLAERRPDFVAHLRENATMEKTMEQLQAELAAKTAELKESNDRFAAEQRKVNIAEAARELDKLLAAAKLPAPAEARVRVQFKEAAEVKGMQEAITAEADYIKQLGITHTAAAPARKGVTGLGVAVQESADAGDEAAKIEAACKSLKKQYMAAGMSESAADSAIAMLQ